MNRSNRGRKAVASHLGLDSASAHAGVVVRGRHSARAKRARGKRGKLPADSTIIGAIARRLWRWTYRLIGAFIVISVGLVIIYRFVDPPVTPLMLIRPLEGLGSG